MITGFFESFGKYVLLLKNSISVPENMYMYWKEVIRHMYSIGIGSLLIVFLIALFIGAVTAVQFAYQLGDTFIPDYYIGYVVRDMTIIELAPTVTCLVLAGKVGSNIASEVGGMRQKEHIDAMEIMGVNTAAYLIMPRLLAAVTVIPILVAIAALVAITGGYLATVPTGYFSSTDYVFGLRTYFDSYNVFMMFVKAVVFAFLLTSVSAFQGYYAEGGSIELGEASTRAVVYSNILILVSDYLVAIVLTS